LKRHHRQCWASETSNKEWRRNQKKKKKKKKKERKERRWPLDDWCAQMKNKPQQEMADTLHLSNHFLLFDSRTNQSENSPQNKSNNKKKKSKMRF
jgi:hypothetical protein